MLYFESLETVNLQETLKISFNINPNTYLPELVSIPLAYYWQVYLLSENSLERWTIICLPAFRKQCECKLSLTTNFEIGT